MAEVRELERPLKALANRRRLAIARYLKREGEATVGNIAGEIDISFKSTSKHLAVLFAADIVDREQRSLQMYYRLTNTNSQKPIVRAIIGFL
ncbi:MAG: metalloregulator ArsR/SmtB family transcription factor [Candidatus Jorgensenbacteria bacterium]|nr:metalloregulator ArsR/SmtB family transcription factor [Candidatus Jorgensenbacteria bacterium]